MSLLKQIAGKGAVLEWSPVAEHANYVALGTKDSAGSGFDDHGGELELHRLDFADAKHQNSQLVGKARANARFSSIAWSQMAVRKEDYTHGLIAGGMADGYIHIWDAAKLANPPEGTTDCEDALLASVEQHSGAVSALHFNPHKESSHLLASGGSDAEVFVTSLEHPDEPSVFVPAPPPNNAKHTADITKVAWNTQVAHILASAAQNGSCFIWDLRQKRAWCELREPSGGLVADVAWNPDQGLHIVTASGDDRNPVIKLWDLRSSTSLPLATLQGHSQGILSVSWCPTDPSLLLSCAKDNRTILWDLFHLQPVYDLPNVSSESLNAGAGGAGLGEVGFGGGAPGGAGMFGGLATTAGQRRYHVAWSPCLPAVVSASSFDRSVQFFSMLGAKSSNGRAPKWLRRPVGATFGFGGKLVSFDSKLIAQSAPAGGSNKKPMGTARVNIHQVVEDQPLVDACDRFHEVISKGEHKQFCDMKVALPEGAISQQEREVWSLMNVICFGSNAREELLTHLGFDSIKITSAAQAYVSSINKLKSTSEEEKPAEDNVMPNSPLPPAPDVSGLSAADAFAVDAPAIEDTITAALKDVVIKETNKPATTIASKPPDLTKVNELWELFQAGEAAEPTIRKAIIVGNFEAAVECCLEAGLMAEALLLAQCGDQALRVRTQAAFFEKRRSEHPFLNVLHAVIRNELMNFVMASDLQRWKETLALLSTYGKSEEFPALCEALAGRLESEVQDAASATLCYMCAANVARTVSFWTAELNAANAQLGHTDTAALQNYVEKVVVFTQANPVDSLGQECANFFAKYAELLANQGRLNVALSYLKGADQAEQILIDRLYHAGTKPAGSRPPPFPFQKVSVDVAITPAVAAAATAAASTALNAAQQMVNAATAANNVATTARGGTQNRTGAAAGRSGSNAGGNAAALAAANAASLAAAASDSAAAVAASLNKTPAAAGAAYVLPSGWLQLVDPTTNHPYYVNQATGQSQWDPPAPAVAATAAVPMVSQPAASAAATTATMPQQQFTSSTVAAGLVSGAAGFMQQSTNPATAAATQGNVVAPEVTTASDLAVAAIQQTQQAAVADMEAVVRLGAVIDQIAAVSSAPAEKRQVAMVRSSFDVLHEQARSGQVSEDVMRKIATLADCLNSRNFVAANQLQSDLANTVWAQHKDWIKGIKVLNQIAAKK